jgi:hypothetical protein
MFPIGTQVSMVVSSANKKLSPRYGSVGYVSGCGRTTLLTKDYEKGLITTPIHIIFTRYGNEKRLRKERRVVLNVIPIELVNLESDVQKVIKIFRINLRKNTSFLKRQMNIDGAICAGIIIPNNTVHNIIKSKELESNAWVESHIEHYYFNKVLRSSLKRLGYPKSFIYQLLKKYHELDLQDVVTAIRAVSVTYNTRNYGNYLTVFESMLSGFGTGSIYHQYQAFFDMYAKDLFDEKKSNQKEEIVKKYKNSTSFHVISTVNMNKTSKALLKLDHSKGA